MIRSLVLGLLSLSSALHAAQPNVLFIYADDWGWGDLACHGHPHLKTPNLDRLAKEGTDFQQFVVCNPVCSPSRTAIVTGQYPARHRVHQHFAGHEENVARGMPDWLDPKVTLLPRLLKEAGYTTGHFGKWHLSGQGKDIDAPLPSEYGYDEAAVWTGPGAGVFEGSSVAKDSGDAHDKQAAAFMTIAATDHAVNFIRAAKGKPFYLNLWLHETHHLVAATEEQKAPYPDTAEPQRTYCAAVTRADAQVGRMLALLDELGLADNTIVIFSSDNGPENSMPNPGQKFYFSVGETGGLRGRKRSLYMGGVNVPFIVRWPGQVPAGRVDKTSVLVGVDVLPTLLAATGVQMPAGYQPDGINVMAAFRGESFTRSQPLFWEWRGPNAQEADWPQFAMRDGFHTLVMSRDEKRIELYDLANDRAQQHDLATSDPDRTATMLAAIQAWKLTLPDQSEPPVAARPRRPAAAPKAPAKPGTDYAGAFKRWDKNSDGFLSLEEYTNGLSKKDSAPQRFKNFDKNSDGKVSLEEFVNR
ncbi:MAG: sulfatase-like hydrolase/transferase [Verrucomicrobiales bacterium]|nr:sulfatase-like hydrolase/transferase [Verrucomicrobiales bacterium]MCP5557242.1 sulfatase-like hydrolase/transferase [Verrucomicrobiaceae bacterium]